MNKVLQQFSKLLREFINLTRFYAISYALYNIIWWLCFYIRTPLSWRLSSWAIKKKSLWLDAHIESKYADIIKRYKHESLPTTPVDTHRIWVFWGQGEDAMPPLIKACYHQLCRHNDNVTLITNDNVSNYLDLSPIIYQKVSDGRISWAHFSDIVRTSLLARYGGLWLDATVWVSGKLPIDKLKTYEIYSANGKVDINSKSICFWTSLEANWSTWCMYALNKNSTLFSFVSKMLQEIAIREAYWPDYVIQDYLIYYAYRHLPGVSRQINTLESWPCKNRNTLATMMNREFDQNAYDNLCATDDFFKLSFRSRWNTVTIDGKMSYYGFILQSINQSII